MMPDWWPYVTFMVVLFILADSIRDLLIRPHYSRWLAAEIKERHEHEEWMRAMLWV